MQLLTQTQLSDEGTITFDVLLCQIVQQTTTLTDHLGQATTGMIVVGVLLHVLGELLNAFGKDSYLNFGGTGVGFVGAVAFDNCGLLIFEHHSGIHLSCFLPAMPGLGSVRAAELSRGVYSLRTLALIQYSTRNGKSKEKSWENDNFFCLIYT